jgi:hypothetical protein
MALCFFVAIAAHPQASASVKKKSAKHSAKHKIAASHKTALHKTSARAKKKTRSKKAAVRRKAIKSRPASRAPGKGAKVPASRLASRSAVSAHAHSRAATRAPSGMAGLGITNGGLTASKALEVRGQSRTLSMMLILRNGKENVNFVKVRQDYATEIAETEF